MQVLLTFDAYRFGLGAAVFRTRMKENHKYVFSLQVTWITLWIRFKARKHGYYQGIWSGGDH